MFFNPIDRRKLKITSPYGKRWDKVKKEYIDHNGTDFRCYDFENHVYQAFVATENSFVLRIKRDEADNGIIVLQPFESEGYKELKYIHINIEECKVKVGQAIPGGTILGYSEIRGESNSHHLHFETVDLDYNKINPMIYIKRYLK